LWIQSWLNYHDYDQVLGWHNHSAGWHGYISIEPQDTVTEFENWTIDNECGNIYFGPGKHSHRVVNLRKYKGKRITLGFDIIFSSDYDNNSLPTENFGAITFTIMFEVNTDLKVKIERVQDVYWSATDSGLVTFDFFTTSRKINFYH